MHENIHTYIIVITTCILYDIASTRRAGGTCVPDGRSVALPGRTASRRAPNEFHYWWLPAWLGAWRLALGSTHTHAHKSTIVLCLPSGRKLAARSRTIQVARLESLPRPPAGQAIHSLQQVMERRWQWIPLPRPPAHVHVGLTARLAILFHCVRSYLFWSIPDGRVGQYT